MTLKERLLEDLKKAEKNQFERMEKVISVILTRIKQKRLKTEEEILDMLEDFIVDYGKRIVNDMEKGDTTDMESSMFAQNIYNEYVSEFKFGGEHRPIYYEHELTGVINTVFENSENAITFKVKAQKK